jgi:hypothetical protein
MSEQILIGVARDLIDAFNAKDSERFKKQLTANVVYDEVGTNRKSQGADAWLQVWEQWRSAFPDVKGTITNAVASGNTVVQTPHRSGRTPTQSQASCRIRRKRAMSRTANVTALMCRIIPVALPLPHAIGIVNG